jgi:BlaI family transcriptional regulator, penicillinase repressor
MTKQKSVTLTKFELEIMRVLWDLERASVREIQEKLSDKRRPAYTTVQTIIHRLEEKSAVRRLRKIGNALIFEPVITRKAVHGRLITELLQLFGGSARPLMAHLAEMGKLNLEDVRELETQMTDQQENPTDSSIQKRGKRDDRS